MISEKIKKLIGDSKYKNANQFNKAHGYRANFLHYVSAWLNRLEPVINNMGYTIVFKKRKT